MTRRGRWVLLAVLGAACGREEILHGIDEAQANQAVVALAEGGVRAQTRRDDASDGMWRVEVSPGDAITAQRLLADRGLPRRAPAGFAEVFGKGSIVPTASEERALYLHALSGELARTIESIDGVVEARVHLALPVQDPLRPEATPPARGAVLVKAARGARARIEPLAPGVRALVAGAVPGLDAGSVAVVVSEAAGGVAEHDAPRARRKLLLGAAAVVALLAMALPLVTIRRSQVRRGVRSALVAVRPALRSLRALGRSS